LFKRNSNYGQGAISGIAQPIHSNTGDGTSNYCGITRLPRYVTLLCEMTGGWYRLEFPVMVKAYVRDAYAIAI
jgi:hypothetical protein